mmetsp:Transcript_30569/g.93558  ORF Transcript_30569/g.93558 Transcript_30569/m.93558 type:complete len:284 (+) Transcript_30569:320-1171(+)
MEEATEFARRYAPRLEGSGLDALPFPIGLDTLSAGWSSARCHSGTALTPCAPAALLLAAPTSTGAGGRARALRPAICRLGPAPAPLPAVCADEAKGLPLPQSFLGGVTGNPSSLPGVWGSMIECRASPYMLQPLPRCPSDTAIPWLAGCIAGLPAEWPPWPRQPAPLHNEAPALNGAIPTTTPGWGMHEGDSCEGPKGEARPVAPTCDMAAGPAAGPPLLPQPFALAPAAMSSCEPRGDSRWRRPPRCICCVCWMRARRCRCSCSALAGSPSSASSTEGTDSS